MTPLQVAQNRSARLVGEARAAAVAYSTSTTPEVREHKFVVEWESDLGGRFWSQPMRESALAQEFETMPDSYSISDVDHASRCWCGGEALA